MDSMNTKNKMNAQYYEININKYINLKKIKADITKNTFVQFASRTQTNRLRLVRGWMIHNQKSFNNIYETIHKFS